MRMCYLLNAIINAYTPGSCGQPWNPSVSTLYTINTHMYMYMYIHVYTMYMYM